MIRFKPIASSSEGNAYLVEADGAAPLLLEAGIPIRKLRAAVKFGLSGLSGCLISHEHLDHAQAVKDLLDAAVDCYMSAGTAWALHSKSLGIIGHHRAHIIEAKRPVLIGGEYYIVPFNLIHDAAEPLGFLIGHGDERLLFIPDTAYVKDRFDGVTILCVECNHNEDILSENIKKSSVHAMVGRRVRRNHMSLEQLINMIKANDLSKCRAIYLLHLSDANSNERRMIEEVQAVTGIPTYAAEVQ